MIIKKKDLIFDALKFVLIAIGEDGPVWQRHIWVRDDTTVCTETGRMHQVNSDLGLEPGLYTVVKNNKTMIEIEKSEKLGLEDIPDGTDIFRDHSDRETLDFHKVGGGHSRRSAIIESLYTTIKRTGQLLNPTLFLEAVDAMPDEYRIFIPPVHYPKGAIIIGSRCRMKLAAVMPMNSRWEELPDGGTRQ